MKLENLNEKIDKKLETPLRQPRFIKVELERSWLGYLVIASAILISALIVISRIVEVYGFNQPAMALTAVAEAKEPAEEELIVISGNQKPKETPPEVKESDRDAGKSWHFYNLDLQEDGQILNDYDFGPNPILDNISADKIKEIVKGKKLSDTVKVKEIIEMLDAEELKNEQICRMHDDPKLGAADMAWMDSILGTRFLGIFYSAAKKQWDVAMNDAADTWIADGEAYDEALGTFERKLNHANKVEIRYQKSGINDQMYMEPDGKNEGVPDIVVMETTNHDGWFLVYTYIIKETKTIEVAYRVDCGFQPCNVAEVMKITPKKNPNKPEPQKSTPTPPTPTPPTPTPPTPTPAPTNNSGGGSSGGSSGGGSHSGGGGGKKTNPDPIPVNPDPVTPDPVQPVEPIPTPPKDPTEGSDVLKNDDGAGSGENTNNPSNPDYSTEDRDTNSNHLTPGETDQAMEDNRWANESGREGGDSNTPSTPPPDNNTHQDNNGGDIDRPTDIQDSSARHDKPGKHISAPD